MSFHQRYRRITATLAGFLIAATLLSPAPVVACPFCTAVSQTLRQEMASMDAVVIAEATKDSVRDEETGEVPLRVVDVLKGEDYIQAGVTIRSVYYGAVEPGRRFMLSGVEPKQLLWSSPLPVEEQAEKYLKKVIALPDDDELARLRFFQQYLQNESAMLARDAYDEFASAPYEAVQKLKDDMNHEQLVEWVKDPEMPADRRRLYLVMLGVCGTKADVPMLEGMLRSTRKEARTGLDSLIACYLTLAGKQGLTTIDELYLANKQSNYADTYAAIMAIRFHGTETDVIPRADLVKSLHHVLDRPDLADLVIPDLARWSDWSQIDRLVALFKNADPNDNWVRVPVVNYMRACPLPAAKQAMEKLKEIDPEAVKRANTFFSAPLPPADKNGETSQLPSDSKASRLAAKTDQVSTDRATFVDQPVAAQPVPGQTLAVAVPPAGGMVTPAGGVMAAATLANGPLTVASIGGPNPWQVLCVMATIAATLMIMGFLVLSGGPHPRAERIPVRVRR